MIKDIFLIDFKMESHNMTETMEEMSTSNNARRLIGLLPMFLLVLLVVLRISWTLYKSFGQKTRNPQQRRMYMGTRQRPSLGQAEPTIFVSPSNMPPPPKYECMAPPSYEEVVGVHYPNYQVQPITQPIAAAMAQSTSSDATNQTATRNTEATRTTEAPETVITVATEPRRTSVTVTRS